MPFTDRRDAGRRLAKVLLDYRRRKPVILALPRGGVPVAAEIADALAAPLDLLIVRKIGVPFQPELAMGAVVDGEAPIIVRNEEVVALSGVSEASFQRVCQHELAEIERRRKRYIGDRPRADIDGRVVIVIDDGIATGATTKAALRALRQRSPEALVLAVPVAPTDTLARLEPEVDHLVCLEHHRDFAAIGYYYQDFSQTTDEEVIDLLAAHPC